MQIFFFLKLTPKNCEMGLRYGGGPERARPVIETGYNKRKIVEVYPMEIIVFTTQNQLNLQLTSFLEDF